MHRKRVRSLGLMEKQSKRGRGNVVKAEMPLSQEEAEGGYWYDNNNTILINETFGERWVPSRQIGSVSRKQ